MALTNKQQLFLAEYLKDRNGTQAAIRAGYSPNAARAQASRLLTNADIIAAVDEETKKRIMPADEVLRNLSEIASGNMAELMNITTMGFTADLLDEDDSGERKPKPQTKLIKKIKQKVTTISANKPGADDKEIVETEFELYSRLDALNTLAKYHGLLVDRTELTGKDGGAIPIEMFERAVKKVYGEPG